jgi:hypothetical protein
LRRVFYHGGVGDLPVGGFILPPCETGYLNGAREDRVYVTTDLMQAINCARIMRGMVYRVRPIGRLGPDDNDIVGPTYTVRRALILARQAVPLAWLKLDEDEFHRLQRDYVDLCMALDYEYWFSNDRAERGFKGGNRGREFGATG